MKTVHIIHGCPTNKERALDPQTRTYNKHWMPWLKKELTTRGYKVNMPLMPNPWEPDYQAFKKKFEKQTVSEEDILIGHSCGTTFLSKWLKDTKQRVAKLILVAPWCIADKDDQVRREFYEELIDETIKNRVKDIVIFTADNEYEDGKKSVQIFHEALGGELIELTGRGHYTMKDMGTEEFPELLAEIAT